MIQFLDGPAAGVELAVTCTQDTSRLDTQRAHMDWVVADFEQQLNAVGRSLNDPSLCHDCGQPEGGQYRTTDEVWEQYGCGRGFLCLPCLDKRMGLAWQQLDLFAMPERGA